MIKQTQGWYIKRGDFAIKILQGESAIVWDDGRNLYAQFDNTKLPYQFTHGKTPMHRQVMVLEVETTDDKITLEYKGKQYRRTVRKGFFDFRGVECKA